LLAEQKNRYSLVVPDRANADVRMHIQLAPTTDARAIPPPLPSPAGAVVLARANAAQSELVLNALIFGGGELCRLPEPNAYRRERASGPRRDLAAARG
jgi:hypothetical protein